MGEKKYAWERHMVFVTYASKSSLVTIIKKVFLYLDATFNFIYCHSTSDTYTTVIVNYL